MPSRVLSLPTVRALPSQLWLGEGERQLAFSYPPFRRFQMNQFRAYLIRLSLSPKTTQLYINTVRMAQGYPDLVDPLTDGKLGASRRDTYRKALLHWATFRRDDELSCRLREVRIEGKRRRVKGPARALDIAEEWPLLVSELREVEGVLGCTLTLLATSGLRLAEVLRLTSTELSTALKKGQVEIKQKGGGLRLFHLVGEDAMEAAEELTELLPDPSSVIWESLLSRRRQTYRAVEDLIRRELATAGERVGIDFSLGPHHLRRTVGDAVRHASGGDMRLVQGVLGHHSLRTTQEWYQDHDLPGETREALEKAMKGLKK